MKFSFAEPALPQTGTLAILVGPEGALGPVATDLDKRTGGALARAVAAGRFKGKAEESLSLFAPAGCELDRVLLVGTGEGDKLDELGVQNLGAAIYAALARNGAAEAAVLVEPPAGGKIPAAAMAAHVAFGARLRSYRFDKYLTQEKPEAKPTLKRLNLLVAESGAAKKAYGKLGEIAEGVELTRDVVSEPPNVIFPISLAERCAELAELGVEVDILDEKRMRKLGMGALLGVAQGSANPPRLVCMVWNGAPDAKDKRPVAFVGKGVTFDSGGISIKPAAGMEEMKYDMAGAGAVIGAMRAIAGRKAKANVVGIVGLVENMPSGTAQRPGDIVTTMSGQTVEVVNTDAEGRLVLADALWYCQETYKPRAIVDLATLTGAIIVALGGEFAGMFAGDDGLAEQLIRAGQRTGEKVWRMPLADAYDKLINTDAADMKNVGDGRNAGSATAAQFLQRFVKDVPWAHLDIAGTAWTKKDVGTIPKGATGYGVRLLDQLVADYYEA